MSNHPLVENAKRRFYNLERNFKMWAKFVAISYTVFAIFFMTMVWLGFG